MTQRDRATVEVDLLVNLPISPRSLIHGRICAAKASFIQTRRYHWQKAPLFSAPASRPNRAVTHNRWVTTNDRHRTHRARGLRPNSRARLSLITSMALHHQKAQKMYPPLPYRLPDQSRTQRGEGFHGGFRANHFVELNCFRTPSAS